MRQSGDVHTTVVMKKLFTSCAGIFFLVTSLYGDVIIEMTAIGNAGNAADWTGSGSVSYTYQISTYEVTVGQYTEFLNAAASSDPYGLYNDYMGTTALGGAFIVRSGEDGSYTYTAVAGTENEPVRYVSYYDGIRLCNWMSNGQGSGDTETGSYDLSLGVNVTRTTSATWVIPSEDEWYKAAYYDPVNDVYYDYPNGSDDVPTEPTDSTTTREMNFGDDPYWNPDGGDREYFTEIGETTGASPYGVYDMGGNVQEWTDTFVAPSYRVTRGGEFMDGASSMRVTGQQPYDPTTEGDLLGLRLAYIVPEPTTFVLFSFGIPFLLRLRRRWD